jgi:hypothetical protein
MGHLLHSIRTTKGRRTECANVQIGVLEEVLPSVKPVGRNPRDRREVINGIRWWVRTGALWRDVPQRDGPWGDLLLPVPHLAAQRHLGRRADQAADPRGCEGPDHLGYVGGLHRGQPEQGLNSTGLWVSSSTTRDLRPAPTRPGRKPPGISRSA